MSLTNIMRREGQRRHPARLMYGEIDSYDPNSHTAKVKFDTELDAQGNPRISGWLPIRQFTAGANAKFVVGPTPGDQCIVEYSEFDQEAGVISGYSHNDVHQPPVVQSGEVKLVVFNATVFIDKNSNVSVTTAGQVTITATKDITITSQADLHLTGKNVKINSTGGNVDINN